MGVSHNFEAEGSRSVLPECHFVRGMLAGFFEEVVGAPVESNEAACEAQGSPRCEFTVRRR